MAFCIGHCSRAAVCAPFVDPSIEICMGAFPRTDEGIACPVKDVGSDVGRHKADMESTAPPVLEELHI